MEKTLANSPTKTPQVATGRDVNVCFCQKERPKSCSGPCVYGFNGDRVFVDVLGKMRSPGSGWFAESTDPDKKREC